MAASCVYYERAEAFEKNQLGFMSWNELKIQ